MIEAKSYSSAKCKGPKLWCTGTFLEEQQGSCSVSAGDTLDKVRASPLLPPSPLLCLPILLWIQLPFHFSFLSTFCWPLKEIGFKPWHELAPQIDLILPHPGEKRKKNEEDPLIFSSFYPRFTSTCYPSPPPLPSTSSVLPFLILSSSLCCVSIRPPPHLVFPSRAILLVSQLSEWHSTSSFSVMDRRRRVLME